MVSIFLYFIETINQQNKFNKTQVQETKKIILCHIKVNFLKNSDKLRMLKVTRGKRNIVGRNKIKGIKADSFWNQYKRTVDCHISVTKE